MYFLNTILETGIQAKALKHKMETELPKNASRSRIQKLIEEFIVRQTKDSGIKSEEFFPVHFEGSPLHLYLLDELVKLDKLDVLGLPDDFKYKDVPFFTYYSKELVSGLNAFRINKNFRKESGKRLSAAKRIAAEVIEETGVKNVSIIQSDGSYLFNIQVSNIGSYNNLEEYNKRLAREKGIAALPYKTGVVRFSLGGFISTQKGQFEIFEKEVHTGLKIYLSYLKKYQDLLAQAGKNADLESLLNQLFAYENESAYLDKIFSDYDEVKSVRKVINKSLIINENRSLYHASPQKSGVSITSIGDSKNSVIEFQGAVGDCRDVVEFIKSSAFTKIYENLLPQIYKNIQQIKNLNFNIVASRYSKATI
jgi:hypothetical protein